MYVDEDEVGDGFGLVFRVIHNIHTYKYTHIYIYINGASHPRSFRMKNHSWVFVPFHPTSLLYRKYITRY